MSVAMQHLSRVVAKIRSTSGVVDLDGPADPRRHDVDHAHLDGRCVKNRNDARCWGTSLHEESIRSSIASEMSEFYPDGIPIEESVVDEIVSASIGVSIDQDDEEQS